MTVDLIEKYGGLAPRYTSYPTAPHFHDGVTAATYAGWLGAIESGTPTSLYLHIPFCDRLCWYCGCHTTVVKRQGPIQAYAKALCAEIDWVAARLGGRPRVTHLHFGGGTPTVLGEADFDTVMERLHHHFDFDPDAELAIEADPRTFTPAMARTLAGAGINRASLGVQDFTPGVQAAINRVQPYETVARCVQTLRDHGITALNFDLIYGLPRQTTEDVENTADLAARLGPDRLSVFGYAHVPWMKTHQALIKEHDLPDGPARLAQADAGAARLMVHGYRQIGLDHFARPGDALAVARDNGTMRRNFQGYTTDQAETLIGLGASAIGGLPQGYLQNTVSTREYMLAIHDGRGATRAGIALTGEDRLRRRIIEGLMCAGSVDLGAAVRDGENAPPDFASERARLDEMRRDGLLDIDGDVVRITETGAHYVRAVAAVFDGYLGRGRARHSRTV